MRMERILSFLIALAMVIGMLPANVWAEETSGDDTQTTETVAPEDDSQTTETTVAAEDPGEGRYADALLKIGEEATLEMENDTEVICGFSPETSGMYRYTVSGGDVNHYVIAYVTDGSWQISTASGRNEETGEIYIYAGLKAGMYYELRMWCSGEGELSRTVCLEALDVDVTIGLEQTEEVTIQGDDIQVLSMTAQEAGEYYLITTVGGWNPIEVLCSEDYNSWQIGTAGVFTFRLGAGDTGLFLLRNNSSEDITREYSFLRGTEVQGLVLDKETISGYPDDTVRLTAGGQPVNSMVSDVQWESSDPDVVSIDYVGNWDCNVKLLTVGTAVITASWGDYTAQCTVTVQDVPTLAADAFETVTIESGERKEFLFTPDASGYYLLRMAERTMEVELRDVNDEIVAHQYPNSYRVFSLEQGVTYKIYCRNYSSETQTDTLELRKAVEPESIEITAPSELVVGRDMGINIQVTPEHAWADAVWVSDNPDVVKITEYSGLYGYVEALSAGEATISITVGDLYAEHTITVNTVDGEIKPGFSEMITLENGTAVYYTVTIEEEGPYCLIIWDSGKISFHMMYEGGPQIHTEDFRAEYYEQLWPGYERTLALRNDSGEDCEFLVEFLAVEGAPESLSFTYVDTEMSEGDSQYIAVFGEPLNASISGIEWTVSDESVIKITDTDARGCSFEAVGSGEAMISASVNGVEVTCTISVSGREAITVGCEKEVEMSPGQEIAYSFTPEADGVYAFIYDAEKGIEAYAQSQEDAAWEQHHSNGALILELTGGVTYFLTVRCSHWETQTCSLALIEAPVVTGMKLDYTDIRLYEGQTSGISVFFEPVGAWAEDVVWTSEDPEVVRVIATENGGVHCRFETVSAGETTLTASLGDLQASCKVTVEKVDGELSPGATVDVTIPAGGKVVYKVAIEESGDYCAYILNAEAVEIGCDHGWTEHYIAGQWRVVDIYEIHGEEILFVSVENYAETDYTGQLTVAAKTQTPAELVVPEDIVMRLESREEVCAYVLPLDSKTVEYAWSCDNEGIVEWNYSGGYLYLYSVSTGTAVFTVTAGDLEKSFEVTVLGADSCGENLKWAFEDGVLTVSGKGAMWDFEGSWNTPWRNYIYEITSIVVEEGVTSVGSYAFEMCGSVQSVSLPSTLETVGCFAFSDLRDLTELTIPASVKTIGEMAFAWLGQVKTLTLPEGLETIGPGAFRGMGISSVNIPASVKALSSDSFRECEYLKTITVAEGNQAYTVVDGVLLTADETTLLFCPAGKTGAFTFPETVTVIGEYAFANTKVFEELVIPEGIVEIGKEAFCGSTLTSVVIPASVTEIGKNVFSDNHNMTRITVDEENPAYADVDGVLFSKDGKTLICYPAGRQGEYAIPEGTEVIAAGAFRICEYLTGVRIPNTVTEIGEQAFAGCTGLSEILIPGSVTELLPVTFEGCENLQSVILEEGVKVLRETVFVMCTKLETVVIPASVERMEYGVFAEGWNEITVIFQGCAPEGEMVFESARGTVYYPKGDDSWSDEVRNRFGGDMTWIALGQIVGLELADPDVQLYTSLGQQPDISNVDFVFVHEDEVRMPARLEELTVGECDTTQVGLTTMCVSYGEFSVEIAVAVHGSATTETLDKDTYPESAHPYENDLTEAKTIYVPGADSITLTFSEDTFFEGPYDWLYLYDAAERLVGEYTGSQLAGKTITVAGDTVVLVLETDGSTVEYGYSFTEITAEVVGHVRGEDVPAKDPTCTENGNTAGYWCEVCQAPAGCIILPKLGHDYVTKITPATEEAQGYTTHTCRRCGDVYADLYTDYEIVAEGECGDTLTWILSADGILTISGEGAMWDCGTSWDTPWRDYRGDVRMVILGDAVTRVGSCAFSNMDALIEVDLGTGLKEIGTESFMGCWNVREIALPESLTQIGEWAFSGCGFEKVSIEDLAAFCRIEFLDDYSSPLMGAKGLYLKGELVTDLVVPEGVESIAPGLFCDYQALTSVTLPDSVERIGAYAFEYCGSLETVQMGNGVTRIGEYAFEGCMELVSLTLSEKLETIDACAFLGCTALQEITLPSAFRSLGEGALVDCIALQNIYVAEENPYVCSVDGVLFSKDKRILIQFPVGRTGSYEIPWGVTEIAEYAFAVCALEEIVLPMSLQRIGMVSFGQCENLTQITIPAGVTRIDGAAFMYSSGISEIVFEGSAPQMEGMTFTVEEATVYYPAGDESWTEEAMALCGEGLTFEASEELGTAVAWVFRDNMLYACCDTFAEAAELAAGNENSFVKLMKDAEETAAITGDFWLDLNGHDLSGITVDGTVYGMDSATDGYVDDGAGTLTLVSGQVAPDVKAEAGQIGAIKRYLAIPGTDGSYSFHRFYFGVTHVSLRPASGGIGYKATFAGDDAVKQYLDAEEGFGLMLSLDGSFENLVPGQYAFFGAAEFPDEGTAVSKSVLLNGIFKSDLTDEELQERADMVIYAGTFLQTKDGHKITSSVVNCSFQEMISAIDANYETYSVRQRVLLRQFYLAYESLLSKWELPNLQEAVA